MRHASIQTTMGYFNRDHMKQVDLVNQLGNTGGNSGGKKSEESGNASIRLAYSRKSKADC